MGLEVRSARLRVAALAVCSLCAPGAAVAQLAAASADRIATGQTAGDRLGTSVAFCGDVDGDLVADYVVGEPFRGGGDAGRATVFSGATGAVIWQFLGDGAGDAFGRAVAGPGDVDNDGRGDILVGAPEDQIAFPLGPGYARLYSGRTGMQIGSWTGTTVGERFGFALSGAGDVNNDGRPDIIIGAWGSSAGAPGAGRVYLYSGIDGSFIRDHLGEAQGDGFGLAVGCAGNNNGDDFGDYMVGSQFNNNPGGVNAGRVYVYSGETGDLIRFHEGLFQGAELGSSVSCAGDMNSDGRDDLLLGARAWDVETDDRRGAAYVYSGMDGALLLDFFGEEPGDWMGFWVSSAGDVSGDGVPDVAIGSPAPPQIGPMRPGRVSLFSGANGALIQRLEGEAIGDEFGSAAACGDANGDGAIDVLIGAPGNDAAGADAGRSYLFFGPFCPQDVNGDGAVNSSDLAILLGGWGEGLIGDFNGDGLINSSDLAALLGAWGPCPAP